MRNDIVFVFYVNKNYQSLSVSLLFSDDRGPLTGEFSFVFPPVPLSAGLLVGT